MKSLVLILILVSLPLSLHSQLFDAEQLEIIELQDMRTLGDNNRLLDFLSSQNPNTVIRALWALANISDTTTAVYAGELLMKSDNENIRSAAAYALGQIPCRLSVDLLVRSLGNEKSVTVSVSVIDALGFVGGEAELSEICRYFSDNPDINSALCLSVGRFARRNIKSDGAVELLKRIVNSTSSDKVHKFASYGFYAVRNGELLASARGEILELARSRNPEARMWAYSSLGYIGKSEDMHDALMNFNTINPWFVRVNFINSLSWYFKKNPSVSENEEIAEFLLNTAENDEINPAVASLRILAEIFQNSVNETLKETICGNIAYKFFRKGRAIDLQVIGEAVSAYGMILKDSAKETLVYLYREQEGFFLKPYIISAFGGFKDASVHNDVRNLITKDVQDYAARNEIVTGEMIAGPELANVYRSYLELLNMLKNRAVSVDKNTMRLIFSEFLSSRDPSIIDVCLNALSDSIYSGSSEETEMILLMDYGDLSYPKDKESMILFINEFGRRKQESAVPVLEKNLLSDDFEIASASASSLRLINGKQYSFGARRRYLHDLNFINNLGSRKYAVLKTYLGDIKIRLLPEIAPFTVQNFVRLTDSGYYNKTLFHRVIPNFVVQGGDPLGSGWGGPEYTIRTEIAPMRYERGMVGMASNGKDTEGSQFFVTHSPFYHLDNRYTIFGEVVSGMEIVDRIFIGDLLESVEIADN